MIGGRRRHDSRERRHLLSHLVVIIQNGHDDPVTSAIKASEEHGVSILVVGYEPLDRGLPSGAVRRTGPQTV